jgi:hypothetical protein
MTAREWTWKAKPATARSRHQSRPRRRWHPSCRCSAPTRRRAGLRTFAPFRLSVVMPVYNEERTVGEVIDELLHPTRRRRSNFSSLTMDRSTRRQRFSNRQQSARQGHHPPREQGKGAAVRTGIASRADRLSPPQFSMPTPSTTPTTFLVSSVHCCSGRAEVVDGSRMLRLLDDVHPSFHPPWSATVS